MRARTIRVTSLGLRIAGGPIDLSQHEHEEPEPGPVKPIHIEKLVKIPGAQLCVVREWAEAMGYWEPEERPNGSSSDGSEV